MTSKQIDEASKKGIVVFNVTLNTLQVISETILQVR